MVFSAIDSNDLMICFLTEVNKLKVSIVSLFLLEISCCCIYSNKHPLSNKWSPLHFCVGPNVIKVDFRTQNFLHLPKFCLRTSF